MIVLKSKKNARESIVKKESILYVFKEGRCIMFKTKDEEFYLNNTSIDAVRDKLNLYKAHSYLLVNIDNISYFEKNFIIFNTGDKCGICEAYMYKMKRFINNFKIS